MKTIKHFLGIIMLMKTILEFKFYFNFFIFNRKNVIKSAKRMLKLKIARKNANRKLLQFKRRKNNLLSSVKYDILVNY